MKIFLLLSENLYFQYLSENYAFTNRKPTFSLFLLLKF